MIDINHFFQFEHLDSAMAEYERVALAAWHRVGDMLGITGSTSGPVADTLHDLRQQVAPRLRYRDSEFGVITTREFDVEADVFAGSQAAAARFLLRSTIRLAHALDFTPRAEITIGEMAVAALRRTGDMTSHLAYRLAEADHIETVRAAMTLGRPVRVRRDFVVRCASLGLGEALNAEHHDASASPEIEEWLAQQRIARGQRG